MTAEAIAKALGGHKAGRGWTARCPAHDDRSPSLSIHETRDDRVLGALLPTGPFPILVLGGEQGSGKSTLARTAKRIVDPGHGDLLQPPGDDRDLIAAARGVAARWSGP